MNVDIEKLIDAVNKISSKDFWDYLVFVVPLIVTIITTLINVWLVNKNTNKQITNQNKETYRPRIRLKNIKVVEHNINDRYLYAYSTGFKGSEDGISLYVNITLENIGNGIANDLSFYMLNSGYKCLGIQVDNKDENQILNSTIEIPKDKIETIKFLFNFNRKQLNKDKDSIDTDDAILLICNYKDLNDNNYKILIGYILKKYEPFKLELTEYDEIYKIYNDGKYSMYYYQENTDSYNCMVEKDAYKDNYKKLLLDIKNNR